MWCALWKHLGDELPHGRGVDDKNGVTDTNLQVGVESERDASIFAARRSNGLRTTGSSQRIGVQGFGVRVQITCLQDACVPDIGAGGMVFCVHKKRTGAEGGVNLCGCLRVKIKGTGPCGGYDGEHGGERGGTGHPGNRHFDTGGGDVSI